MTNFYICTHKNFNIDENLKGNYKIITDGSELDGNYSYPVLKADNILATMKHSYSEGYMIYDIWKNDTDSDYIGINHYRRYLQLQLFEDDIKENVLPIPFSFDMYAQYDRCHHINDLLLAKDIINKYYPSINTNSNCLFACNTVVLEHDIFDDWCKFIFGVLEIFNDTLNLTSDEDVRKYIGQFFPDSKLEYQSRLHGFLIERLSTIYLNNKFSNDKARYSQTIMLS